MAATPIASILSQVRDFLVEKKARFWSDPELKALFVNGVNDLWGNILDVHGDHYFLVNEDDVVLKANDTKLSGVPENCFRVQLIEPRDTSVDGTGHQIIFTPKKFKDPQFVVARTQSAFDLGLATEVFYQLSGVGAPIHAPIIYTAPKLTDDMPIRFCYNPTIDVDDDNPIPGQSDNALKAWVIAYALAKEGPQGQRIPDPGWLGIYATEKTSILTRITPRQEQDPEVVDDLFQGYGHV